jgi:hypothetical protein
LLRAAEQRTIASATYPSPELARTSARLAGFVALWCGGVRFTYIGYPQRQAESQRRFNAPVVFLDQGE